MKKTNNVKLSIYLDNRIIIENYDELSSIGENEIKIDIYHIVGEFLKIHRMDDYMIEINGKINQIIIGKKL